MNTYIRCSLLVTLLLTLAVCGVSQTSAPRQKSSSSASGAKSLSFFVGSWVQAQSEEVESKSGDESATISTNRTGRMVVANSKADELSVNATCGVGVNTVKSTPKWGNPRSVLESSDFKGTILKVGSDYKYTIAPTACHATWRNVDGTEQGDRICQFCPTDPKTYTLKILSDDEILLIYKPTGEEIGRFKRE